eukprot:1194807-Prorocentrum_minimum.AAC.4
MEKERPMSEKCRSFSLSMHLPILKRSGSQVTFDTRELHGGVCMGGFAWGGEGGISHLDFKGGVRDPKGPNPKIPPDEAKIPFKSRLISMEMFRVSPLSSSILDHSVVDFLGGGPDPPEAI